MTGFAAMNIVALTLMGVARSARLDMVLEEPTSMMQLHADLGGLDFANMSVEQGFDPTSMFMKLEASRVAILQTTLPWMCKNLDWATPSDCNVSEELVNFIIAQNETGNDVDVAKRVINLPMLAYGPPAQVLSNYDVDVSGNLSEAEFRQVVKKGMGLPDESIAAAMALFDRNQDGTLTTPEIYQFGRACLVVRQFLREIDPASPTIKSVDLLPALETNLLHVPESTPENLKWHFNFTALSSNLTAECQALYWTEEVDCEMAQTLLDALITVPTWNGTNTLKLAQGFSGLEIMVHASDRVFFGKMDDDRDNVISKADFIDNSEIMRKLLGGRDGVNTFFDLLDHDGTMNVTRDEAYAFVRGALVLRHFIPDLDPVVKGRLSNGSSTLTDQGALNMARHIIQPPPAPVKRLDPGLKFLCLIALITATVAFQWKCCSTPRKQRIEEDSDAEEVPTSKK
mmetsp:Transcript_113799/g.232834  ORF Transcript_113799/g.232834 Transcript_113799/m.232834 type:complete len:456 (+) Transcript_113799:82-1449(+)